MRNKILKFELFFIFFATIASFVYFYYGDRLPDHYLAISSGSESANFFMYYSSSLLAFVGHYTGPWTFFVLMILALAHSFLFVRRDSVLDIMNVFWLSSFFAIAGYLFFPEMLGSGLYFIIHSLASTWIAGVALVVFFMLAAYGIFRSSIHPTNIRATYESIAYSLGFFKRVLVRLKGFNFLSKLTIKTLRTFKFSRSLVEKFLKEKTENRLVLPVPVKQEEEQEEQFFETIAEAPVKKTEDTEEAQTETYSTLKVRKKVTNYKSKDLISSMSNNSSRKKIKNPSQNYFTEIIDRLEEKLEEFRIDGKIINVLKGPVVDTFELELGAGVKVSKVNSITEDLSLALCGVPIRLVYPLTGKSTMGIEVPRSPREIIYLDEVMSTEEFLTSKRRIPICMGKDAYGEPFVSDLASMPHMLIAGATGAGKSVFLNTLLVSLLIKKSPEDLKLLLIDPKQLELALYADLPHLILPVITDGKMASVALIWACQEMERRYSILKEMGVRGIDAFNEKIKSAPAEKLAKLNRHYEGQEDQGYRLPYLVIIVDEFADLILTKVGKEIENNICRLAAKARAAGIHLVLATQRPSVDVITGLIKSNFPTRVSFKVTTSIDSRTILSAQGAEKLLGMGDMLYKHGIEMRRLHSAYVDEFEIEALVERLKSIPTNYDDNALDFLESGGEVESDPYSYNPAGVSIDSSSGDDQMTKEAIKVIAEHKKASASFLQRRLSIGYNRAANIIENLEEKGIVGPAQGSKPREILVSAKDLQGS